MGGNDKFYILFTVAQGTLLWYPTAYRCKNTLCLKKNDNDVPHYNFNANQPILIIFGRYIAE